MGAISTIEIVWLAAWLEGEGSFGWENPTKNQAKLPRITGSTSDHDVAQRAGSILGARLRYRKPGSSGPPQKKPMWEVRLYGAQATGWMMTLYPFMGRRRKARIKQVLQAWRAIPLPKAANLSQIWGRAESARRVRDFHLESLSPLLGQKPILL